MKRPNIYGRPYDVNRDSSAFNELIWLHDLETYVFKNDTNLPFASIGKYFFLDGNEDILLENCEYVVRTVDTESIMQRSHCYYADDTCEYYEKPYDLTHIYDLDIYVTDDHAQNNYYYHENRDAWYSYEEEEERFGLMDYCQKAESFFGFFDENGKVKDTGRTQFFGLEMEYEYEGSPDDETVQSIVQKHRFIATEDGSLDEGFELKGAPMTYSVAKDAIKSCIEELKQSIDFDGHDTCGVHIHVSRASLSDLQVGLIQRFIYAESSHDFITKVAGRRPNSYCYRDRDAYTVTGRLRKERSYVDKQTGKLRYTYKHRGEGHHSRYECMNMTSGHTIEFRLFAGTAKVAQLHRYMEFVKALIEFTSPSNRQQSIKEKVDVDTFMKYIRKYRKQFPNLFDCTKSFAENSGKAEIVNLKAGRGISRKEKKQIKTKAA